MVFVAPGITRFAVHGEFGGQPTVNILDMQVDTTGSTVSRADANFSIAGDILNNWSDHILPRQVTEFTARRVTWLDLDSENGDLGERFITSAETWPAVGGETGPAMPGGVAGLVTKQIVGTRGRRSGRMYLPGMTEAATDDSAPNEFTAAQQTAWNAALQLFLDGINDQNVQPQRQLVVVHSSGPTKANPEAPVVFNGWTEVTALSLDGTLATQRRRQR